MFFNLNLLLALASLSAVLAAPLPRPHLRKRCAAQQAITAASAASAMGVESSPTVASSSTTPASPSSTSKPKPKPTSAPASTASTGCFPSAGFNMPDSPPSSLDNWWCSRSSEYAFMGFSYAVDSCPSESDMTNDFKQMQSQYGARYVRLYAACDRDGFFDDVVSAGWNAGVGVFSLVWFGFDGGNQWQSRMAAIESTITNNPKAQFIIRNVAVGSEPLYDNVLPADQLAQQVQDVHAKVNKFGVQASVSDMAYLLAQHPDVVSAVDHIESNTLPFFANDATTGGNAWGSVQSDLSTYQNIGGGKKVYLTQTGWPSNQDVWKANSGSADASVASEKAYYDLLDSKCSTFKSFQSGGAGWFAHIWSDQGLPGWGITSNGQPKFDFSARTHC